LASGAFGLYAIAAGVIVPAVPFVPGCWLNQDTFAAATGLPIQLVRTVLAICVTFAVYAHSSTAIPVNSDAANCRVTSRLAAWTVCCLLAVLGFGMDHR